MRCVKNVLVLVGVVTAVSLAASSSTAQAPGPSAPRGTKVRVGTFDSRALAIAYYRSPAFEKEIGELRTKLKEAEASGNTQLAKKLAADGPALQSLVHKQGFGTFPVDNLLAKIKDQLPTIARQADVSVIISKWRIAYQSDGVEFVDVTDAMVAPFGPDEKTSKIIEDMKNKAPLPLDQLNDLD